MSIIGQAFTADPPAVGDSGPTWASTLLTYLAEVEERLAAMLDSTSITLTTGDVIHGTRYLQQGAADGQSLTATWTPGTGATAGYWLGAGAANTVEFTPPLCRYQRVTALRMTGRSTGTAWTFRAWLVDASAGTRTQLGSTQTSGTATSIEELSVTGLTTTLADNQNIVLEWTSGAASTRCLGIEVVYDRAVAT